MSSLTLFNPMDSSVLGFPVLHYFLKFTQTHVHWISDAIQPSHPLSPLLLPSVFRSIKVLPNKFQLFTSGSQSIGISASASVLPMNTQDWFPLGLVWSPCSPKDSQEFSPTPQFKSIYSLTLSFPTQYSSIWIYKAKLTEFKGEIN